MVFYFRRFFRFSRLFFISRFGLGLDTEVCGRLYFGRFGVLFFRGWEFFWVSFGGIKVI